MRFCTSCQTNREEEGGVMRKLRSTARWVCAPCLNRNTNSIYKAKRPTTKRDLVKFAVYLRGTQ